MACRWWVVLPLMACSVAWSQVLAPATAPSTRPATTTAAYDASTPKGALRMLFNATDRGDVDTIRSVLYTATPLEAKLADAMAQMASADAGLRKAAKDAFGDQAMKAEFGDVDASGKIRDEALDKMPETIQGDTAVVMLQNMGRITPVDFKKVDGQWKFLVGKSLEKADTATVEKQIAVIGVQAKAYRDVTTDLLAGKYKNVPDVKQTLEARVRQALMQYVQNQTKAATQASQPTTMP